MRSINNLSRTDDISPSDLIPVYQGGTTRAGTVSELAEAVAEIIEGSPDQTIYNLPASGDSFSLSVVPASVGASAWVKLDLNAPKASATITLPSIDVRASGQEILVTTDEAITALSVVASNATVVGAPTTLAANGFFRMRYDNLPSTWTRVG